MSTLTTATHRSSAAQRTWLAFALRSLGIVFLSTLVAAGYAAARSLPWTPDVKQLEERRARHDELRATAGVALADFLDLIEQGAIVLDTRSAEAFAAGHISASQTIVLNVPADEIDSQLAALEDYRGSTFVLYCTSDQCDLSEEVYVAMVGAGFEPDLMHIYFPGWEGIREAGLDIESDYSLTTADEPLEP